MTNRLPANAWAALGAGWLAFAWAVQDLTDHYTLGHWFGLPVLLAGAIAMAVTFRGDRRGPWLILAVGVGAGVIEHLWRAPIAESQVLTQIVAASRLLWSGQDPYLVPAAAMPDGRYLYPPGPLLFYGATLKLVGGFVAVESIERGTSILTILVLAATAYWAGPGRAALAATAFGTYLFGTFRTLDGDSNATLALFFVVGSFLLMRAEADDRRGRIAYWVSVPVLAFGVLLKQLAWPIYLFIALHLCSTDRGRRHVLATLGLVALAILPFAIDDITVVPRMLGVVGNKPTIYGMNILGVLQMFRPDVAHALIPTTVIVELVAAAVAALFLVRTGSRDFPDAVVRALGLMFILMVLSNWTSPAYYMFMGTLLLFVIAVVGTRAPSPVRGISLSEIGTLPMIRPVVERLRRRRGQTEAPVRG